MEKKDKKIGKKAKEVKELEELNAELLEKYVEGESNLDHSQLNADEIWNVIYPFTSPSIEEKEAILGRQLPLITKDEWLEREIAKIKAENPKVPAYKVQDPNALRLKYQQKFVEAAREIQPQIIEDLKELVPSFQILFAKEYTRKYHEIFGDLNHSLSSHWRIYPDYYNKSIFDFDQSYLWDALKLALYLANIQYYISVVGTADTVSDSIIQQIEENKYLLNAFSNAVKTAFKETTASEDLILSNYFHLQGKICDWADKYNLKKDWLIEYAYYFIYQFSQNSGLETKDVEIGIKDYNYANTFYDPFEFKAGGWWVAEQGETAIQYKARVTKEFEKKLEQYITEASSDLKLNELSKYTRPPSFTSVLWLANCIIKSWNSEQVLEKFFPEIAVNKTKDKASFLTFENKIKYIKSEIRKLKKFNLPTPKNL